MSDFIVVKPVFIGDIDSAGAIVGAFIPPAACHVLYKKQGSWPPADIVPGAFSPTVVPAGASG